MSRTIDTLIAEIHDHHEILDATAAEADRLGTAPDALVALMRELRVPMVKAPVDAGGDGLTLAEQLRYFAALAYENATAGWTGFNHAGAASIAAAKLPEAGFREVFAANPAPFFAAVSAPTGRFRNTAGGLVVNGVWKFASGCMHADWALVTAVGEEDSPGLRPVVIPMRDIRRQGEWNVMALKGTASIDLACEDVHVPADRVINPMQPPLRGGPEFGLSYFVYVAGENLGFTLGVAERFLAEARAHARTKSRGFSSTLSRREAFAYEIGKAQTQLASVRALGIATLEEAWELCQANGQLTASQENKVTATTAYGTSLCAEVVSHLFHFLGATAIFDDSILQRCFRDVHGSAQHLVASNEAYDRYGGDLLGDG